MGLDVYMYHNEGPYSWSEVDAATDAWETASAALWASATVVDGMVLGGPTAAEMAAAFSAPGAPWASVLVREGGEDDLFADVVPVGVTKVEHPLPGHDESETICRVGYLRSSYNGGGLNAVLRRLGLLELDDIFCPGGRYEFVPDWSEALARARKVRAALGEAASTPGYDLVRARADALRTFDDEASAVAAVTELLDRDHTFESFSNRDGTFFTRGLTVYGAVSVRGWIGPEPHLVVRRELHPSYLLSLDCAVAMCELALTDGHGGATYRLVWSG